MWRSIIIALALICLGLLGWYGVRKYPGRVEAAIQSRAQKALDSKVPGVIVKVSQRDAVLGGAVANDAERKAAETLVAELAGVKTVVSQIVLGPLVAPQPEPPREAAVSLDVRWTGSALTLSGELPQVLAAEVDQKIRSSFDTTVDKRLTINEGALPAGASEAVAAALDALVMSFEGKASVRGKALTLEATVASPDLEAAIKAQVTKVGGVATVTVKAPEVPATDDATDAVAAVADTVVEAAPADVGPAEVATPEVAPADTAPPADVTPVEVKPAEEPGGSLDAAACKAMVQAAIEGEKRLTFKPFSGKLTDEGELKLQEVAKILARCPKAKGVIEGYYDDYGDPDKLKELTQIRAYNVHKRLGTLGLDTTRFRYIGLGYRNMRYGTKPGQRVLNQRVEFNITVE